MRKNCLRVDIFAGREYYGRENMEVHEKERFMKRFCSDLSAHKYKIWI